MIFPYRWHWNRDRTFDGVTYGPPWDRWPRFDRKDQRLRVVCRGTMNSALVEFEDGHRAVVSRNGLRRA